MTDPIRIFVGAPPDGLDAESQMVCEWSLRKRSSQPIELTWLQTSRDVTSPLYGWDTRLWATNFSGYRWATPYLAQIGKAIYLDCDTICCADIAELWNKVIPDGKVAIARGGWRYCVSLWNVPAALAVLMPLMELKQADGHARQNGYFRTHPALTYPVGADWNYLDNEDYGTLQGAKIVHYTDLRYQPSMSHAVARLAAEGRKHWNKRPVRKHPRRDVTELFEASLAEALAAGYTPQQYYQ